MIGWLIYQKQDAQANHSYVEWFIKEAKKQDICLNLVYQKQLIIKIELGKLQVYSEGVHVPAPDFVIMRTVEPFLQTQFEQMKIPVFNDSRTARICNHKAFTYLEMAQIGIPIMPTVYITSTEPPDNLPFPFPFILKEATGRGGDGVYLIDNEEKWIRILGDSHATDYIAQTCHHVQFGKDIRVFVIGQEIIAAVLRSNDSDFRANYSLGGTATLFHLTADMKKTIQKIIAHFDFGMVGIDFLLHNDGWLIFNEIEDVVGSRILSATTDINLLEKYMTHIKRTIITKK